MIRLKYRSEAKKIALIIAHAFQDQQLVKVIVINEDDVEEVTGLILHIDQETHRIKITHDRGVDWIPLDEIFNVEFVK